MIPIKSLISIDRKSIQPLYIQLANQIIELIKNRKLQPNAKLPGSRSLAVLLKVHRKTVIASYEELILQGWLEAIPQKGTFVHSQLPILHKQDLTKNQMEKGRIQSNFAFDQKTILKRNFKKNTKNYISLNDGVSDPRLAPTQDISRIYSRIIRKKHNQPYLTYGSTYGNPKLREVLSSYLNESRGLHSRK